MKCQSVIIDLENSELKTDMEKLKDIITSRITDHFSKELKNLEVNIFENKVKTTITISALKERLQDSESKRLQETAKETGVRHL